MRSPRNISASVRQRLLNQARSEQRPFNELLQYYAMERFLYRLAQSSHAGRFVLKGALMLRVWRLPEFRPTMDIDMLGRMSNDESDIAAMIRDILTLVVEEDGLAFDPDSIQIERITEGADYHGIRIRFLGALGLARINMQIDIGFGDIVYPQTQESDFPVMLDFSAPRLFCYSQESFISEKFEATVKLGMLNSRMKDFYDIWILSRRFHFDGTKLSEAVRRTFERRGTELPKVIEVFEDSFIDSKQKQWAAFQKRLRPNHVPVTLREIMESVNRFLSPVVEFLLNRKPFPMKWNAPGPWILDGG